jgi:hypothetical protein
MKNARRSFWAENGPLMVLAFTVCLPALVGAIYKALH